MKYRYCIYFNPDSTKRPYYVYDLKTEKVVGTYTTFENAKAKYPSSDDYTWIGKGE